jgi:hypothetical protein
VACVLAQVNKYVLKLENHAIEVISVVKPPGFHIEQKVEKLDASPIHLMYRSITTVYISVVGP